MIDQGARAPGRYVAAHGLEIYYEEFGSGPPLILLHGGTSVCQEWAPLIPALAEHFHLFALDSRGHGRTRNPSGEFGYALMADDVAAFVTALGLAHPRFYGFSDGAQIALELGMRYPALPQALVLAGVCYRYDAASLAWMQEIGFAGPGEVDLAHFARNEPGWAAYLQRVQVHMGDPNYWQTLLRQISVMWCAPMHYSAEELARIQAPTLLLLGDREEMVMAEQGLEMYRMIPHSELAIVPNADHGATRRAPGTPALVLDFLLRHTHG